MRKRIFTLLFALSFMMAGLTPLNTHNTQAKSSAPQPSRVSSPYDLIAAVNNLRAANGLSPYQVNPILMTIAQAHAEYMAATGSVTHYSADGSRPYQRALAAGYPVAGDLSRGGWFSENIIAGLNLSAQGAMDAWMGDAPHQNTMLSSTYREVGAGVATAGDKVYYTLDADLATGSQPIIPTTGSNATPRPLLASTGTVIPNTPNPDGSVLHIVQKNETILLIAYAYGIPVDEFLRLNKLTLAATIFIGQQLIIRPAFTPTPTLPTETPTRRPTATPWLTSTASPTLPSTLLIPTPIAKAAVPISSGVVSVAVIILLALVVAGVVAWLGTSVSNK